jgi:hypothetical protein
MTRSGFEYILSKHATTAASKQPSIATNLSNRSQFRPRFRVQS